MSVTELEARDITVRYGGVTALQNVSLTIRGGDVLGLVGPNGAGKTSLLNAVSGITALDEGSVTLDKRRIDGLPAHRIARSGVVRTYQNVRLFRNLSVEQNVLAGAFAARNQTSRANVAHVLARTALNDVDPATKAANLPYGAQRRLEIARALASEPLMILLDEPAAGLNPEETSRLAALIRSIAADGSGVLLVEHDMQLVNDVCDRVVVLNFGRTLAHGTPGEIGQNPDVIEAYLGTTR